MKKRLTLNYVWAECIKMYTHVVKRYQPGMSVIQLKQAWLHRYGYKTEELNSDCFFCEYDERHQPAIRNNCNWCPGRLADSIFYCGSMGYTWSTKPNLFLKEIIRLDEKRRTK